MNNFFYICSYLNITPMDFFDYTSVRPGYTEMLQEELNKLTDDQFNHIKEIIEELARLNGR